jgi:hypothetical protein
VSVVDVRDRLVYRFGLANLDVLAPGRAKLGEDVERRVLDVEPAKRNHPIVDVS